MSHNSINTKPKEDNLDPLTGAPGAHPVGSGVGATGGGLAGAAIGAVGGPIGAAIGIAVGAVAGGLAGKAVAESIDPTAEDAYWRANYATRPYVTKGDPFDVYEAGYRTAYENYGQYRGRTFDDAEADLRKQHEKRVGKDGTSWEKTKQAARDAWQRLDDYIPGDSNRDGH